MDFLKKFARVIFTITKVIIKFLLFMAVMLFGGYLLAPMGVINSKDIDMSSFTHTPNDTIMTMLQHEMFSGYLFMVTITLFSFVAYLFWQLHEVAVHKAEKHRSTQIQLVFALSLCGLFIHKAWWVMAIIIAFANWKHIAASISRVISNGVNGKYGDENVKSTSVAPTAPGLTANEPLTAPSNITASKE